MKFDRNNPKIGDIVYKIYRANTFGKIISIVEKRTLAHLTKVEVRWCRKKKPQTEIVTTWDLMGLEDLIDDHKKKLHNLQKRAERARNLPDEVCP